MIYYAPKAKLWHKESQTIGKASAFSMYYSARNPLIVHMRYRLPNEYLAVIKKRMNTYLRATIKLLLKGKLIVMFRMWQGYFSAIKWGIRNKKLHSGYFGNDKSE